MIESRDSNRYLYTCVHDSIIHNSQKVDEWRNKMWYVPSVMVNLMCELQGCFWIKLTFKLVNCEQIILHNVVGLIELKNWPPEQEGTLQQTSFCLHLHHQSAGLRTGMASLTHLSVQAASVRTGSTLVVPPGLKHAGPHCRP